MKKAGSYEETRDYLAYDLRRLNLPCRYAENLRDLRSAGVAAGRASAVRRGPCHKRAGVAVATGKPATAAIGAWKGGRDETDARIFLHGEVFVRNCQRKGGYRAHGCHY